MIFDTNALSAWADGDSGLLSSAPTDRAWYIPSIVIGEYRFGVLKSTRRAELEQWLDSIENACISLAADAETARHYADLRLACAAHGGEVPYHDLWIGALAIQHSLPVLSRDAHFDLMPGVWRVGW